MDTSETYVKTQICSKCGLEKHYFDFSIDNTVESGRRSYCKRCQSIYNISHPHKNDSIKRKLYDEKHRQKDTYKSHHKIDAQKHRQKYSQKVKARLAGQIFPKQPCEICGNEKSQAHHDDYSKPHIVRWLCKKHHEEIEHGYKP